MVATATSLLYLNKELYRVKLSRIQISPPFRRDEFLILDPYKATRFCVETPIKDHQHFEVLFRY